MIHSALPNPPSLGHSTESNYGVKLRGKALYEGKHRVSHGLKRRSKPELKVNMVHRTPSVTRAKAPGAVDDSLPSGRTRGGAVIAKSRVMPKPGGISLYFIKG